MMQSNISKNDWSKVKGEIQRTWSSLSANELEETHGDVNEICHLVQEKYGLKQEDAERRLDEVIRRCGTAAGKASVTPPSSSTSSSSRSSSSYSSSPSEAESRFEADGGPRGQQSPAMPNQPSRSAQGPGRDERSRENVKSTPSQSQRSDTSRKS